MRFAVFALREKVEGMVVRDPYVVSSQIVIKPFYVRQGIIRECLVALTHKHHQRVRQRLGFASERPFRWDISRRFGVMRPHPSLKQGVAAAYRQLVVMEIQAVKCVKHILWNTRFTLFMPAAVVYKPRQIAVLVRSIFAVQDIPRNADVWVLQLDGHAVKLVGLAFPEIVPAAGADALPLMQDIAQEAGAVPLIACEILERYLLRVGLRRCLAGERHRL